MPAEHNRSCVVAYIGAKLPSLSETFVYKELLAVMAAGVSVVPISVFRGTRAFAEEDLESLRTTAVVVYRSRAAFSALVELVCKPVRTARTLFRSIRDAAQAEDTRGTVKLKAPLQALAAVGLAGELRRRRVEHIHAHMANTPTTIAMYAAMQLGIGFSFTGHANDLFTHRSLLNLKLQRAAFVACISRWHERWYRSRVPGLPPEATVIVRCGVDQSRVARSPAAQGRADGLRLVSVGRLVPKKGMLTLVEALGRLRGHTRLCCDIIGEGPQRSAIERRIADLGLAGRVRMLGGMDNAKLLATINEYDAFVLACERDQATGDQDGIPVSLMEAMAAGLCVVTSDLEPIDELVRDGDTGICFKAGSSESLAEAIESIVKDRVVRESLARRGQYFVSSEFGRTENAHRLVHQFQACCDRARRE